VIEKEEDQILARDRATSLIFYWQNDYLSSDSSSVQENPSKPGNLRICFAC
jgi:hypothetical protein